MSGLAALTFAYVLSQFYRSFLAVLTPALIADLGATKGELSGASGAWFAGFAAAQILVGISLDRYGPKRTAAIILAVFGGGGALLFAFASGPWMVIVAMGLIGVGCAPVLMAASFIFAHTYSPARLGFLISWYVGLGSLGIVVGASPLANAAEAFGWRAVMAVFAAVTVLTGLAIAVFVRDPKLEHEEAGAGGLSGYLQLFRIRQLWPILPLIGLNYAPAIGIRGLWAGPYLSDVYGADALLIGNATLVISIATVAGAFVYGPLDSFFGTRKWVSVGGNLLSVLVLAWLALQPAPGLWLATALLAVLGLIGNSYGVLMAHGRSFLPSHLTGRGMTLLNLFSIGEVGIAQFLSGPVYAAAQVPDRPEVGYAALFGYFGLLLAVALAAYLFSQDVRPQSAADEISAPVR